MDHKTGLVSVSFRNLAPEDILQAMKQCGLEYIEWGSDVHAPLEKAPQIAALQRRYGIRCCAYGTYFRLGETPLCQLEDYIRAAGILGTNILRLWCGTKNSERYTAPEKEALFSLCREASAIAEKHGAVLCMECHGGTYTNRKEAALELMDAVDSPHFRMYWQPNSLRSHAENMAYATLLAPYTQHLHVFYWTGKEKHPLKEGANLWREYLSCFPESKTLLLEFMPDGKPETLRQEAEALREILK